MSGAVQQSCHEEVLVSCNSGRSRSGVRETGRPSLPAGSLAGFHMQRSAKIPRQRHRRDLAYNNRQALECDVLFEESTSEGGPVARGSTLLCVGQGAEAPSESGSASDSSAHAVSALGTSDSGSTLSSRSSPSTPSCDGAMHTRTQLAE